MRFLLSIKTVFPKPGGKVWYDDQREVHRQIFQGDETIDYAVMGKNPDAADNRWLKDACEFQIPVIGPMLDALKQLTVGTFACRAVQRTIPTAIGWQCVSSVSRRLHKSLG
jgi:hypothetical protein